MSVWTSKQPTFIFEEKVEWIMGSFTVENPQFNFVGDGSVDVSHSAVTPADSDTSGVCRFPYGRIHPTDFRVRSSTHNIRRSGAVDHLQGEVVQRNANFLPFFHSDNPGSIWCAQK